MAEDHGHDAHGGGGAAAGGGEDHGKGEHKAHKSHGGGHGGGGHEEHAGAPEWLISFADNVALLMGFFVILLAMNMGPKGKADAATAGEGPNQGVTEKEGKGFSEWEMNYIELKYGLRKGFNNPPKADSPNAEDRKLLSDYNKVQEQKKARRDRVEGDSDKKQATPNGTKVVPNLTVEFDDGRDALSVRSRELIEQVVNRELIDKGWVVEVRGHVSATEAKKARLAQMAGSGDEDASPDQGNGDVGLNTGAGYQLSYQRALVVAREMARCGLPWRNMRIVACSDTDRNKPRESEEQSNRQRNQRVEIIQTSDPLPPDPLSQMPGQGPN